MREYYKKVCIGLFFITIAFLQNIYCQNQFDLVDMVKAKLLLFQSDSLMKAREFENAIKLAQEADSIYIDNLGEINGHRMVTHDVIGKIYYHWQKLDSAENTFLTSIEILEKVYGKNSKKGAPFYNNLGYLYLAKGKYESAVNTFRIALKSQLKVTKYNSLGVAERFQAIGRAYQYLELLDSALINLRKAYEIQKELDTKGLKTARSLEAIATVLSEKGDLAESIKAYEKVDEIYSLKLKEDHPDLLSLRSNLSEAYKGAGRFKDAKEIKLLNLKIKKSKYEHNHSSIALELNNIGTIYARLGLIDSARIYYQEAIESLPKELLNRHLHSTLLSNLGGVYSDIGDLENAILYYRKSFAIRIKEINKTHPDIAFSMTNLASQYNAKGQNDEAINLLKNAISNLSSTNESHPALISMYNSLGLFYSENGDNENAISYFNQALDRANSLSSFNELEQHTPLSNLAIDYYKKGNYEKAKYLLEKVIEIRTQIYGYNSEHIHSRIKLARIYEMENNFEGAEQIYFDCLKSFQFEKNISLNEVKLDYKFLPLLEQIIRFYREEFIRTKSLSRLKGSNYFSDIGKKYIEYLSTQIGSGSRKFFQDDSKSVFQEGIRTKYLLFSETDSIKYLKQAFMFSELSKATLLKEAIYNTYALKVKDLPQALLVEENRIRKNITHFEKLLREKFNEGKLETDPSLSPLNEEIFTLKKEYTDVLEEIKKSNEKYFTTKYDFSTTPISKIQLELLWPNQTLIEFFVGDSSIFTFIISKEDFSIIESPIDFPLDQYVKDLREGICQPYQTNNTLSADSLNNLYSESAFQLYEKLILPIRKFLPGQGELIIIPDGVLGYIPFDALLTQPVDKTTKPRDYPYLLKEYQSSIAYSATLLKEMKNKRHYKSPGKNFLGVAPLFEEQEDNSLYSVRFIDPSNPRNWLSPLKANIPEVQSIQRMIGGDVLISKEATESAFIKIAKDYKVLHLSTHGKANDKFGDYSFLAFYELKDSIENEWLYNRELYDLELNADMVVLSACETGIGELQRGEGIISLARGFSYAGAKSIITSLWAVDDEESPILMNSFYTYLDEGYRKDAALRQAKLDYIQSSSKPYPYFWATFIPIGDMQPISFDPGIPSWIWMGIIGLILTIILWFYLKKLKTHPSS